MLLLFKIIVIIIIFIIIIIIYFRPKRWKIVPFGVANTFISDVASKLVLTSVFQSINENLSFQDNDEIDELELDVFVQNVILDAQASLANVFITVSSTLAATVQEQVMTLAFAADRAEKFRALTTSTNELCSLLLRTRVLTFNNSQKHLSYILVKTNKKELKFHFLNK